MTAHSLPTLDLRFKMTDSKHTGHEARLPAVFPEEISRRGAAVRRLSVCSCALLLSACAFVPPPEIPETVDVISAAPGYSTNPLVKHGVSADQLLWWRKIGGAELASWVTRLKQHNFELAEARERVVQANEFAKQARSGRLPRVSGDLGASRNRTSDLFGKFDWGDQYSAGLVPGNDLANVSIKPTLCLGGHGLFGTIGDYERLCLMILNRGELDGVRVLRPETVDLMFQNHLKSELGQKYGLGGAVDGEGGYSWGGANGTQFWLDRTNNLFAIFMVQTQLYKAPTYGTFKSLANESAGIASKGGMGALGGGGGASAMSSQFKQRDTNNDGKLTRDELPAALFDRLDADKDGSVTEAELTALWKQN